MVRKLLRPVVTIVTPFVLAGGLLFGVGLWRKADDADWCRRATAGGVVAGSQGLAPPVLDDMRSACRVQRERQRVMFSGVWRQGGQAAAQCGFELARLQLMADHDPDGRDALLQRYGIDPSGFEISDRPDQDRFLQACRSNATG